MRFRIDPRAALGALVVLASRLATLPRTPWEFDEFLFLRAVRSFDPLHHHPHPPGYPLFVGMGKVAAALVGDPFAGLVALSVVATVVGWIAFYGAFRRLIANADVAVAAALIFYLSAGMLIHSSLALADSTALMFLALTFRALAANEPTASDACAAGIWAAAAIGCRPQLAIPLLAALAVAFFLLLRTWRARAMAALAFTIVSLAWLLPLIHATGGWSGFLGYELHQARWVAAHDAAASRGSKTLLRVAARFVLRPWGDSVTIAMVGLFAVLGVVPLWRRRSARLLPLFLFSAIHWVFAIAAMDPADAVRYALPALPPVALLAALGLGAIPWPRALWIGTAAVAALSLWYVSPILIERASGPSPVAQAAAWVRANVPRDALILYQGVTQPHAEWLLPAYRKRNVEEALGEYYDRPDVALVLFAEGGSRAAGAKVFGWRESEAYTKMTRNFGRRITVQSVAPEERFLPLRGIEGLERTADDEEWRWLRSDAALRLPSLGKSKVTLTFGLSSDAPYDTNDVVVFIGGRRAGEVTVSKSPTPLTLPIPPGRVDVEIRSARSFCPADVLGNRDTRTLAVELLGVRQR